MTDIFSSEVFMRQRDPVNKHDKEGRFWTILLCLYHGMRINEAASLLISDVKKEGEIWYLDLSEFDDEGNRIKRLKTTTSPRRIPLHRDIIEIGFLEFVDVQREEDESERLFPDLRPDSKGNYGASVSKWFTRIRNEIIGKPEVRGDKSLHSLRHLVATAIREITDSDEILYAIGGWGKKGEANSSRRYGKQSLARMKETLDQIEFKGIDASMLMK